MATVGITKAKAQLSRLIDRALDGHEVIITRHGKPLVKLEPIAGGIENRDMTTRVWLGPVYMSDDFDDLPDDVLAAFEGEST